MSVQDTDGFGSEDFDGDDNEKFSTDEVLKNTQKFSFPGVQVYQQKQEDYYDYLTTYKFKTPDGVQQKIPVPVRWHPQGVFRRIIQHNKIGQYTGIVEIGMSGSGKTTLTRMFLHRVHEMGENYVVKWFTGADMLNIDKIIDACVVGMPHILIFDDASYTMEDAKKEDVARLANALTTIRHKIKSRIITIMNIHYSKATKKFFRNQHFTFLTSISTEEMGNYADLFKGRMGVIMKFARMYNKMMLQGYFEIPISSATYQTLRFKTNEPFRVGIVAEISDLHFMLYSKESCSMCDPETDHNMLQNPAEVLRKMCNRWSESTCRNALQYFASIYEGKNYLSPQHAEIFAYLANIQKQVKLPLGEMLNELRERKSKGDPKSRGSKKKYRDVSVMEVVKMHKEQQEAKKKEKNAEAEDVIAPPSSAPQGTPDYDSLYVSKKFEDQ